MDGDRVHRRDRENRWRDVAGYGLAAVLSLLLVDWAMRLWQADLSVPFSYRNDSLLNQLWIKTLIDHGWYLHNDAVGAPTGLDMHDYPLVDSLFFAILKLVSWFTRDVGRTINVYYLLTFPLTTLAALAAMRRLGIDYGPALVAALLISILPYHFFRGEDHLFLSSYFLIPPMVGVLLRTYLGEGDPRREVPTTTAQEWRSRLRDVAICLLIGCGGIYYAFFSCYFLLIAGLGAGLGRRRLRPFGRCGVLIGVIVLGVAANLAPKLLYDLSHGTNRFAIVRLAGESEVYGLKLIQLVEPLAGHRLEILASLRASLDRELPHLNKSEAADAALGTIGTIGFLWLLVRPLARRGSRRPDALDGLSLLNLSALLLAVVGGVGTIFNVAVRPEIRCYNRISVFIGCFSLMALAFLATKLRGRLTGSLPKALYHASLALILVCGSLDQTTPGFVPPYNQLARDFASDAEFVGRIEGSLPAGALVFQLPAIGFPELPDSHRMGCYDHFRCYLHSRQVRWSHGVMRGRRGDAWRIWVALKPLEDQVSTLAFVGFSGICIDRNGYADGGADIEGKLTRILGAGPALVSRDGTHCFFRLDEFTNRLRGLYTAAEWTEWWRRSLYPVTYTLGRGFFGEEWPSTGRFSWSAAASEFVLTNPSPMPRPIRLAMRLVPGVPGLARITIRGPHWRETLVIDDGGTEVVRELVLLPGETRLKLQCAGDPVDGDGRVFRFERYSVEALGSRPGTSDLSLSQAPGGRP